jgi:hypothetical protein
MAVTYEGHDKFLDEQTRAAWLDGRRTLEQVNADRERIGLPPLTDADNPQLVAKNAAERQEVVDQLRMAAQPLMSGKNIRSAESISDPQVADLRRNAMNVAGSQAADLARRGMAYSGMADKAVRDTGTNLAAESATARTKATNQVEGWKRDSYNAGFDIIKTANDQTISMELLKLAKQRADQLNTEAVDDAVL